MATLTVKEVRKLINGLPDDGHVAVINYTGGGSWEMAILGTESIDGDLFITVAE